MGVEFSPRNYSLAGPENERAVERGPCHRAVVRLPDSAQTAEGADAAL